MVKIFFPSGKGANVLDFIRVQHEDFDQAACYDRLQGEGKYGAIVTFTGIVRDFAQDKTLSAIELDHYPKMTEKSMQRLVANAHERFSLGNVVLIHRVGKLLANEQIVYVGVSSTHRQAAFDAAQYLMDTLKNDVPLWKKEIDEHGKSEWVESKKSDHDAKQRWDRA